MIDYNKLLSSTVKGIRPSGIRKFFDIAAEMDDVISLGVGEPDFQTPWHIRQAGIKSLQDGKTKYTSNWGLIELRKAVAEYMKEQNGVDYDPQHEILISVGGSEAIDAAVRALISNGDEVLIVEPSFVCYDPIVTLAGGTPIPISTKVENRFRLTADELKAHITDKTKLLILPYPGNPTGAIMERED